MMNFWFLLIILGIAYLTQMVLSTLQLKDFSTAFAAMRRRGKVAIGKHKNALSAGAIVLFLLDDDGFIVEGRYICGLTIVARFKPLIGFDGLHITEVLGGPMLRLPVPLRLAITNAHDNWRTVQLGEIPTEPPGPWTRLAQRFSRKHSQATIESPNPSLQFITKE